MVDFFTKPLNNYLSKIEIFQGIPYFRDIGIGFMDPYLNQCSTSKINPIVGTVMDNQGNDTGQN